VLLAASSKQSGLLVTSRSKHNPTGICFGKSRAIHGQEVKLLTEGDVNCWHIEHLSNALDFAQLSLQVKAFT